jgi:hypothetical protein
MSLKYMHLVQARKSGFWPFKSFSLCIGFWSWEWTLSCYPRSFLALHLDTSIASTASLATISVRRMFANASSEHLMHEFALKQPFYFLLYMIWLWHFVFNYFVLLAIITIVFLFFLVPNWSNECTPFPLVNLSCCSASKFCQNIMYVAHIKLR